MRFLHLSDLHLGKRVCEFSMLDDQRYILEQVLSLLNTVYFKDEWYDRFQSKDTKPDTFTKADGSPLDPAGQPDLTFTNVYKPAPTPSSVTDQVKATKVLSGRELTAGEFSFELVEGEGKDAKVIATGKNAADGKITMSPIEYTKAGTHAYTLREVKGGTTSKGITYSDAKYTIETTITDNGDGTLSATDVLKDDVKDATFETAYSVTPLDAELDFDLSKAINGRDWTDSDKFSFTITAPEGTPLPEPATVTVSKKDAKDGIAAIKFGKIHYTAAGTYKYEIRENAGSAAGMTAAAMVELSGGTPSQCADACAVAIANQLGLVCDPVAGLVEIPCIKRNASGVAGAFVAAELALAGIRSAIPADEVIWSMKKVGDVMPAALKETAEGGLAATPTGVRIAERLAENDG